MPLSRSWPRTVDGVACAAQGPVWTKAVVERCFGSCKRARPVPRPYATRQEARDDGMNALARCSNSTRTPSSLGDLSPHEGGAVTQVAEWRVRFYWTTILRSPQHF